MKKENTLKEKKIWYLPNPQKLEAIGPFTIEEIHKKLDQGELALDNYIWNSNMVIERWLRIYEVEEFQSIQKEYPKCLLPKKRSKGLSSQVISVNFDYKQEGEYGKENVYRRYPRAPINVRAIIHNQKLLCEAEGLDISEKGILLKVDDIHLFKNGEEIIITILEHPFLGTLSIPAAIVNRLKKHSFNAYGLYFLRVPPQIKRKLATYVIEELHKMHASTV
ncbi:MAG: PilZ domain-containing protein [Bacteriovoracia bacterium]